ncbi:MAG: DUF2341 domain-containing protein [Candidatus Liptonbacteria bacterium]|nr:DUF2341 domain-containing protein [Candidatus Liptonbacteria bacterium]
MTRPFFKNNLFLAAFFAVILASGLLLAPKTSNAWWDSSWQNRRTITFNGNSSTAALTDFPILVNLNSTNIDYSKTQDSGQDIRFVDSDDSTALNYEIDRWDETATSSVWVKIPSIATGTADSIYMYYNNTGASDGQNATGTWDSNFVLVSHFGAQDASSTDSTVNANNGTVTAATATTTAAIAGYSKRFDGTNDKIDYGSGASMGNLTQKTITTWVKRDAIAIGTLATKPGDGYWTWFLVGSSPTSRMRFRQEWSNPSSTATWISTTNLTATPTYMLSVSYDNSAISNDPTFYVNGVAEALTTDTNAASSLSFPDDSTQVLNQGEAAAGSFDFNGKYDELRMSNTIRSADWIRAEYKNGVDTFNAYGGEESAPASPPGAPGTPTYNGQASSTPGSVTVNWTASSGSPDYYKIENSADSNTFSQVATTSATSYATTTLSANITYWYRVRGNNAGGDGSYSASSSVLTYPGTPGTPTYSNVSSTSLTINWTDPTGGASSTKIERATSANGTYSQIATTSSLSYTNTGLATSTTYWYRVRSTNATGDGLYSATSSQATTLGGTGCGGGSSNISSSTGKYWAWNDLIGWIDFCGTNNVVVTSTGISGYASSSAGEVSLDCATSPSGDICASSNYQVSNDGSGNLSGWAWNDVYGWISFCGNAGSGSSWSGSTWDCPASPTYQVTIDSSGNFSGFAWSDAAGWISFNCNQTTGNTCATSDYQVLTSWTGAAAASTSTGVLDSATFDTGISSGAQLNSFLWHGYKPSNANVYFQFAVSNSSNGPWNFMGTDGTANTYYNVAADTPMPLDYSLFNGYRYFRYRVTLVGNSNGWSPRVDDVVVKWSP